MENFNTLASFLSSKGVEYTVKNFTPEREVYFFNYNGWSFTCSIIDTMSVYWIKFFAHNGEEVIDYSDSSDYASESRLVDQLNRFFN